MRKVKETPNNLTRLTFALSKPNAKSSNQLPFWDRLMAHFVEITRAALPRLEQMPKRMPNMAQDL
jgi:hypothetical protein